MPGWYSENPTMRRSIAPILFLSLTLTLAAAPDPARIRVPHADAPKIDGKVDRKEWRISTRVQLTRNQGYAMLMHDEEYLYVALVGTNPGIGSLCIRSGKGVRVLHASAALGTAAFELDENGKWKMTRGFNWSNREVSDVRVATAERNTMLSKSNWFANTSATASREREYQLKIGNAKELAMVLAFVTYTPKEQKVNYWPERILDDCGDVELASGYTDREYKFEPDTWGTIILE